MQANGLGPKVKTSNIFSTAANPIVHSRQYCPGQLAAKKNWQMYHLLVSISPGLNKKAGYVKLVHVLLDDIFVRDDITIIWDENIVYFFNWEKTTCFGPIRSLFT